MAAERSAEKKDQWLARPARLRIGSWNVRLSHTKKHLAVSLCGSLHPFVKRVWTVCEPNCPEVPATPPLAFIARHSQLMVQFLHCVAGNKAHPNMNPKLVPTRCPSQPTAFPLRSCSLCNVWQQSSQT